MEEAKGSGEEEKGTRGGDNWKKEVYRAGEVVKEEVAKRRNGEDYNVDRHRESD